MDTTNKYWFNRIANYRDVFLAFFIITIIMMMIIPLPATLLDILLTFNISFALIILLVAMFNKDPLDFSVFPSILLVMTLFRLSLNISTTRLILLYADAGDVIAAFGEFVVGGNPVVGFIIFLILVVIQFIVITKGAERVSEVGARFTLDAMPGKQMAIDADLNAGLINEQDAKIRREKIQSEADFYGAMDGASKFVKGDAVAGIIIVIINIVGGLVIGMLQKDMTLSAASNIYTILTVGDGLVSQIPALLISTATGIVVTRSASEKSLGEDVGSQLFGKPVALAITALVLFVLGSIGLPRAPMYLMGLILAVLFFAFRSKTAVETEELETPEAAEVEEIKHSDNLIELMQVEKMEMEMGYGLIPLVDSEQGGDLLDRIVMIRRQCAMELGFIVPPIRIRDNMQLKPNAYSIKIKGIEMAAGELLLDRYMAIGPDIENDEDLTGIDTIEPAFNLAARWIDINQKDKAEMKGYTVVDPPSVLSTHLTTLIKSHAYELLGRQEVQKIIDYVREQNAAVIEELIPDLLNIGQIQKVLANLLKEQISIRDINSILETLADYARNVHDPDILTEYVRQALKRQISNQYADAEQKLYVITLDPAIEERMRESLHQSDLGSYLALDPDFAQKLMDKLTLQYQNLNNKGLTAIVLIPPVLRIYFKRLTDKFIPNLVVLSYNEIESGLNVEVVGMVSI